MLQVIRVTNSEAVFIHCICASFKSSQYLIHIELFNPNFIVTRIIRESKHDKNIYRVKYIVAKLRICNLLFHLHTCRSYESWWNPTTIQAYHVPFCFTGSQVSTLFFTRRNNTFWDIPTAASLGGQLNMFSRVINDPNSLWLDVLFNLTLSLSLGGCALVSPMNQPEFPGAHLSTNVVELAWQMYKAR